MNKRLLAGAILLALVVIGLVWGIKSLHDDSETQPFKSHGIAEIAKKATSASVAFAEGLPDDAEVAAQLRDNAPQGVRASAMLDGDTLTISLSKPSPKFLRADWVVSGTSSTGNGFAWNDPVNVALFTIIAIALLLGAYLLSGNSAGEALLFGAYAKVLGLLVIVGVGLIGGILASEATNMEAFTPVFTLLGIVAGYLAGTRPDQQLESGLGDDGDDGGGGGGGGDEDEAVRRGRAASQLRRARPTITRGSPL